MLSKIAGLMKSEMSRAAAMFVGAQSKFLGVLEAYKDKLPAEDVVEAKPPPSPEDAPAAEVSHEDAPAAEEAPPRMPSGGAPAAEAGDRARSSETTTRPKPRLRAAKRRSESWPS